MNEKMKREMDEILAGKILAYDKAAKGVLSGKKVLAYILKRTIPEFESASLTDIADFYIEGEAEISTIPVSKDRTNAGRQALKKQKNHKIKGNQNEDNSVTEGGIVFDILFRAKVPDTHEIITLIINVEAQKSIHPRSKEGIEYPLMKRAVYYVSRLLSSQKETEFTGSNYEKIKKVYSIWLCMEAPEGRSAINRYQLKEQHLLRRYKEPQENYDLMGIVFVYLGDNKVKDRLIKLLNLLFKPEIKATEKITTLRDEYGINLTDEQEEGLNIMNLGEGIVERTAKKIEYNTKRDMVIKLWKEGVSLTIIKNVTGWTEQQVKSLLQKKRLL